MATRKALALRQTAGAVFDGAGYSLCEVSTKAGKTAGCMAWLGEQATKGRDGHDGDGIGDLCDPNMDGDEADNLADRDMDGDGWPWQLDRDNDGDGVLNEDDRFDWHPTYI